MILVVENIVLRQRAAVYVSDSGLHAHAIFKAKLPVLLSVRHGHHGLGHWPRDHERLAAAVGLAVDAVQVLGDADATTVHQELRRQVALRSCGGGKKAVLLTLGHRNSE